MLNPAEEEKVGIVVRTHWLIYFAFAMAIIMYTVVVFLVVPGRTTEGPEIGLLRQLFIFISVAATVMKFWIQSRLLSDEASYRACRNLDETIAKYWRYNFLMLALCEIPAMLGLVAVFVSARMADWWLFLGISAVLFATSAPASAKLRRIIEAHEARWQADM